MLKHLLLTGSLMLPGLAFAECDAPSKNAELVDSLDAARSAFGQLEIDAFTEAYDQALAHLECLNEPVSRSTAAEFHRVSGLALFLKRNGPAAAKSFAAARKIEPAYTFPTDLVPEGNPMLDTYAEIDPESGETALIPPPKTGSIKLDGGSSLNRKTNLPAIFQLFDGRGAVTQSALVQADEPLPDYPTSGGATETPTAKGGGPNIPLLAGAGGALVIAGGLTAVAASARGAHNNATSVADADAARSLNNTTLIGAGVAGGVAVGLGAGSFLLSGRF